MTLTDLPTELPLLRRNLAANQVIPSDAVRVEACAWGDEAHLAALGTFDVILCSDVLYQNDERTQLALARTVRRLAAPGSGRVLFAYHFRENILADAPFFEAVEPMFGGNPSQHAVEGELEDELWLFEYSLGNANANAPPG